MALGGIARLKRALDVVEGDITMHRLLLRRIGRRSGIEQKFCSLICKKCERRCDSTYYKLVNPYSPSRVSPLSPSVVYKISWSLSKLSSVSDSVWSDEVPPSSDALS